MPTHIELKLPNPNSPLLPTPPQPPTIPYYRPTPLLPLPWRHISSLSSHSPSINRIESADLPLPNPNSLLLPTPPQPPTIHHYKPIPLLPGCSAPESHSSSYSFSTSSSFLFSSFSFALA